MSRDITSRLSVPVIGTGNQAVIRALELEIERLRWRVADLEDAFSRAAATIGRRTDRYLAERALADELAECLAREAWTHDGAAALAKWREARK